MAFPTLDPRFSFLSPGAFPCSGVAHFEMIPCCLLGITKRNVGATLEQHHVEASPTLPVGTTDEPLVGEVVKRECCVCPTGLKLDGG